MEEASRTVYEAAERCLMDNVTDWTKIKTEIKDELSEFVWKRTQRRPMILPIIMEASV
jgi:ribonuclease J